MVPLKHCRSFFLFLKKSDFLLRYRPFTTSQSTIESLIENKGLVSENIQDSLHSNDFSKKIPLTKEDYLSYRRLTPCQPENPRLLSVAILGEPNVGKSTLTNALVKWKVCAVSRKVHTTRKKAAAILVEDNKQIVFLDTPGFVTPEISKKHNLEPSFVMDPVLSLRAADLIAVVVDIANKWTNNRINEEILHVLKTYKNKKSILILNKVDAMKSKSRLLNMTRILTGGIVDGVKNTNLAQDPSHKELTMNEIIDLACKAPEQSQESNVDVDPVEENKNGQSRGWTYFSRVFMVSALKNDGIDNLREYLFNETIPRKWTYHNSIVTDQHPHEMALMIVREKLLEYLPEEIPYLLDLKISKWEILSTGSPKIDIKIMCSNSRHKRFVIGPGGKHIAACVENSRKTMREAFRKDVVLNIGVI